MFEFATLQNVGFAATRLGVILRPQADQPNEACGVFNPGGVVANDGSVHLFPRLVDNGNCSRIGHVRLRSAGDGSHTVERLGVALAPDGPDDAGGCEDARVTYVPLLERYVMTYTAVGGGGSRVAIAVSHDLTDWTRLGVVRYESAWTEVDLNACANKDAALFPDVIFDPQGVPSFGLLHRPTTQRADGYREHVWLSYTPVESALNNIARLTSVRRHEPLFAPSQSWESTKVGAGAPPVRAAYGWLLPYHGVSTINGRLRYCMGLAVLDLERPTRVLYRTPRPVLEPITSYERRDGGAAIVFPTASLLRSDGDLDIFYGAADRIVAQARISVPATIA